MYVYTDEQLDDGKVVEVDAVGEVGQLACGNVLGQFVGHPYQQEGIVYYIYIGKGTEIERSYSYNCGNAQGEAHVLVQAVIGIVNYHAAAEVEVLAGYLSLQESVERFFGGLEEVQEGFVVEGGQEKEGEQYGQRAAALEGFVEQGDGAVKEDFHFHAPECPVDSRQRVVGEYARQVRLEEIEKGEIAGKVAPGVRMQEIVGGG